MKSANKDLRDELPDRIAQCQVEHHQFWPKDSDSFSTECLCTVTPKIKPLKQKEATSRLYLGLDPPSKNIQNVCLVFFKCVCEVSKQLSLSVALDLVCPVASCSCCHAVPTMMDCSPLHSETNDPSFFKLLSSDILSQ